MSRLSRYLVKLFAGNALALLAVAAVLIWLIQCLRIFDVVSVKGQGLQTLAGQALLTMPPLLMVFLYMVMGIGLARALSDLRFSQEMHIIHSSRRLSALMASIAIYAVGGAVVALLLSNFFDPLATRKLNDWSEEIAADLVSRTLTPHRFSQVVPGVAILIEGRQGEGEITGFFADDRRDSSNRRTYIAKTAVIQSDDDGYVIHMRDGSLQYLTDENEFSQISFRTYDIAMKRLTDAPGERNSLSEKTSPEIFDIVHETGHWTTAAVKQIAGRMAEGLRVIAMCLLVAALAAFPSGRRSRFRLPLEVVVLVVAFAERGISTYLPVSAGLLPFAGALTILAIGMVIMAVRLGLHRPSARLFASIAQARGRS